jgi:hypothetical protein
MLKNSRIFFTLATMALVLCMAADSFALQTSSRKSQGNNYGLELNLGNSIFTGTSEYPRGSGNSIPTYEGAWGHFLSVARDLDGDGVSDDTLMGAGRGRTHYGRRASLEAMDLVLQGKAAGHRMDQWMERVENNEVWSSLDPDNLARWPAEFRQGRTMSGAPILFGAETICAMHSDVWNRSYHHSVPPTGGSLEYQFYFLDFGESNDLAFGHLFLRNMSEYLKYNDNQSFVDQVAATPDGQVWKEFALMYVESYFGIGFSAASMDEGWAYHPARGIKCMVDQNGLEDGFTNGGMAFMIGYAHLKNMEFGGETAYLSNTTNYRWGADFGISKALDIGNMGDPGQVHRWATCLQPDGTEKDISDFYGDETSPYTGRTLTGNPGVILPTDEYYNTWLWGRQARINYHAWSGLHDFGPRDTTSTDFVIMAAYPTNPPLVMKPNDIANLYDPDMQVQLAPFEQMQDVASLVYGGGYILPETPIPPALTIVPGDRQVTLTWSNVNLNTPDNYYYFIQNNPDVDPNGIYREYDFEGFRLYRSFVGPSDAHAEMIWESSLGAGNLAFHYIDKRADDEPFHRMRNGMKIWYSLVPYDRNYDPASGDLLSLPALDQSKVWNRSFPANYHTVRSRSDASDFTPASAGAVSYTGSATNSASVVELAGDGTGKLTDAPQWLTPSVGDVVVVPVIDERITSDFSVNIATDGWWHNGEGCGQRRPMATRTMKMVMGSEEVVSSKVLAGYSGDVQTLSFFDPPTSEGISFSLEVPFDGLHNPGTYRHEYVRNMDIGAYTGTVTNKHASWCQSRPGTAPGMLGLVRNARYTITWKSSANGMTVDIQDLTHGVGVAASQYQDELGWGFMTPDLYGSDVGQTGKPGNYYFETFRDKVARADRQYLMVSELPADYETHFGLWINGTVWVIEGGMPVDGTVMTMDIAWGDWNADKTVFTQVADMPWFDDSWKIEVKAMSMNAEDADLSKIRVVPNPYIASSMLDQSGGSRRIDFINLPSRCTVRIYSLGGNLVNVLNHIGASRTGWGNYTDLDNIQPDNTPLEFTGYDNHSGSEPWNMKNRFGQTVASGLYFYHVTDERGETHIGKFYIVN